MLLSQADFEALVDEALAELPSFFAEKMSNVAVLVQPWPTTEDLRRVGLGPGYTLLGLYHGVPLTERGSGYALVAPDTITLYQAPIERAAGPSLAALRKQVRRTVLHELAHHFGISDNRLHELGAY